MMYNDNATHGDNLDDHYRAADRSRATGAALAGGATLDLFAAPGSRAMQVSILAIS